jgi:hypothetical protein
MIGLLEALRVVARMVLKAPLGQAREQSSIQPFLPINTLIALR